MEVLDDYQAILLGGRPLIDLRAPLEFARGSVPGAVSLPLLSDTERAKVGTRYKRDGQAAAIALGHQLVGGEVREERLRRWIIELQRRPESALFCWRGGLRSQTVQTWLADAGWPVPRVAGGYKALRHWLITQLEARCTQEEVVLVAGRTGVGKTEVLGAAARAVDLEAHAHHRGSGFGATLVPQPSQIDFEHALTVDWLRLTDGERVYMEDESRCIGSCALPEPLWARFQSAPIVVVEDSMEARVERIRRDYVVERLAQLGDDDSGWAALGDFLLGALDRIARRLGGERHAQLRAMVREALHQHRTRGAEASHDGWIGRLLVEYYDPMYDYQLSRRTRPILARGSHSEIREYLADQ